MIEYVFRHLQEDTLTLVRIESLDHLVLTVANVEATVALTSSWGCAARHSAMDKFALCFGDQKINLHQSGAEISPNAAIATPGSADLCFLVADPVDDVLRALEGAGINVELRPVSRTGASGALTSIYIRDPDRNLVELSRLAP